LEAEKKKAAGSEKSHHFPARQRRPDHDRHRRFQPPGRLHDQSRLEGRVRQLPAGDGTFWPVPVTLDAGKEDADAIKVGEEIALFDPEGNEIMATMKVTEKFEMTAADKKWECEKIFMGEGTKTAEDFWKIAKDDHPGRSDGHGPKEFNLAGPVKVLSEGEYPTRYKGVYHRPAESRKIFDERGWKEVAALQLRNPMHRSHEYLCKIAVEVCDGVYIHSLVGNLKPGDIPASVRVNCIDALVKNYFVEKHVVQGGYPLDMRYAGPREGLLHATFRQNYGCSRMIIGRDHAGVGDFYGMFEAQTIFDKIPAQRRNPARPCCARR
jgi:sulfate adenylyltransferase